MAPPDFNKETIRILSERAGLRCSSPSCGRPTTGPNSKRDKATRTGEAAHIRAARGGEARFDKSMTDKQRADISNAIWLCAHCHKMVDDDELEFPAGELEKWKIYHERNIREELEGKSKIGADSVTIPSVVIDSPIPFNFKFERGFSFWSSTKLNVSAIVLDTSIIPPQSPRNQVFLKLLNVGKVSAENLLIKWKFDIPLFQSLISQFKKHPSFDMRWGKDKYRIMDLSTATTHNNSGSFSIAYLLPFEMQHENCELTIPSDYLDCCAVYLFFLADTQTNKASIPPLHVQIEYSGASGNRFEKKFNLSLNPDFSDFLISCNSIDDIKHISDIKKVDIMLMSGYFSVEQLS